MGADWGLRHTRAQVKRNGHLDAFLREHSDPHGERLGNWIVEKMGGEGDVWTAERRTRPNVAVAVAGGQRVVVNDRSSAHVAAWYVSCDVRVCMAIRCVAA